MMPKLKNLLPHALVSLVSLGINLFYLSSLPEQVPVHWNISGEIDGYGSRYTTLLWPALMLVLLGLFWVLPRIDPKAKNYSSFNQTYLWICLGSLVFLLLFNALVLFNQLSLLPQAMNFTKICLVGCGLLFAALGKALPSVSPNYFVGIRTPWTLSDEKTWVATHIFAGGVWLWGGIFSATCAALLATPMDYAGFFGGISAIGLAPVIFSFWFYRRFAHSGVHSTSRRKE